MDLLSVVLLIVLGVILLLVEFMLIPGISIAGVGSVIAFGAAIFLSFRYFGSLVGYLTLAAVLIAVPVLLYFLFKGKAVKPMMLESDVDGVVRTVDEQHIHAGDQGVTISRCTPGGKAKINGLSVEVRSLGIFIDPHTPVEVVRIEGNIVIVKPIK